MYLRKSTLPGEENRSLELQEQTCRDIAARAGYALIERPYKQVVSGYALDAPRREFQRLLDDVEAGKVDVILCFRIDRLGRRVSETGRLMDLCQQHNVKIHHSAGLTDPSNATDALYFSIISAMAQNESASISERVRADRAQRRYTSWLGGNVPYGMQPAPRNEDGNVILIPHPTESVVIRRAYDLAVNEKRSATAVAEALDTEGFRLRSGEPWTMKRVQRVLLNPVLAGYAVGTPGGPRSRKSAYAEIIYKDGEPVRIHEGVLSVEEWEAAKAAIGVKSNRNSKAQKRSPFLSGLVFCDRCGRKMVSGVNTKNGRTYRRYVCPGYAEPPASRCSNGFSREPLETFVKDYVRVTLKDPRFRAALDRRARAADSPQTQERLLERLDSLREAQAALEGALADTLSARTISTLTTRLEQVELDSQEVSAELQAARVAAETAFSIKDIYDAIQSMDALDRRYAIDSVIDEVRVLPGPRMIVPGMMGGATVDLSRIKIRRRYSRTWDQLSEPTPAPTPSTVECSQCHDLIERTDFIRAHSKSCTGPSRSSDGD